MREMHGHCVGVVGHERAAWAALLLTRREHEVLNQKLAAAVEQIGEPLPAAAPLEGVLLVDADPRQLAGAAARPDRCAASSPFRRRADRAAPRARLRVLR